MHEQKEHYIKLQVKQKFEKSALTNKYYIQIKTDLLHIRKFNYFLLSLSDLHISKKCSSNLL